MTESDATRNYLVYCVEALRLFFQGRSQVYVSGNLFIYYEEGNPRKNISPDVFVVFGVSKRQRRSYKVWQEGGKLPSFVLEITSKTTRNQDENQKPELYANLGIQEYFQYDPTGDYLNPQLKGRRLVNGQYEAIPATHLADGTTVLQSQTLGLDLRLLPISQATLNFPGVPMRELRLFDPQTQTKLLNYQESDAARVAAEQLAEEERQRAAQEALRADEERQRAEQETLRADEERQRAEQETLRAEAARQRAERAEQQLAELLEQLRSQSDNP
ncbi:MAG: Uma2 family endonuclease [Oculatellaceae cyanobacterium Prado106]|jgi:Uma2 family endonuclease|nr:Uma2 family endonuclease [Oculatellaceae cyanobacterium Prado106]